MITFKQVKKGFWEAGGSTLRPLSFDYFLMTLLAFGYSILEFLYTNFVIVVKV